MDIQTEYNSAKHIDDGLPHLPTIQENTGVTDELEPKRLELASILQKTLEPLELIKLFAQELGKYVPYDGLRYRFINLNVDLSLGNLKPHSCSYELMITEEALGTITMFRETAFQERELAIAENMLAGLLYPLRNTLLYQEALQSATTDPLTGVKNRAAMDTAMRREIGLASRHGTPLSFILFDLDHFKSINDQFGHMIGDQVLRDIAKVAEDTIRDSDIIFRYGGEEFLILLSGTKISGASLLAERLRMNVEHMKIFSELDLKISASMGVVSLAKGENSESLFKRADNALYKAKQNGRNQVVIDDSI